MPTGHAEGGGNKPFWWQKTFSRREIVAAGLGLGLTGVGIFLRLRNTDSLSPNKELQKIPTLGAFTTLVENYSKQIEPTADSVYEQTLTTGENSSVSMQTAAFYATSQRKLLLSSDEQSALRGQIIQKLFENQAVPFSSAIQIVLQEVINSVPDYQLLYIPRLMAWTVSLIPKPPFTSSELLHVNPNKEIFPQTNDIPTNSVTIFLAQMETIAKEGTNIDPDNRNSINMLRTSIIEGYEQLLKISLSTQYGEKIYQLAQGIDNNALRLPSIDSHDLPPSLAEFCFYFTSGTYSDTIASNGTYTLADVTEGLQGDNARRSFASLKQKNLHWGLFWNANYALLESSMMAMSYPPYLMLQTVLTNLFYVAKHSCVSLSPVSTPTPKD